MTEEEKIITSDETVMFEMSKEDMERITFLPPDPREGGIFTAKGTPLLHNDGVSGLVNVIEKWIDDQVERRMAERDAEAAKSQCNSLTWIEQSDMLVRCSLKEHDSYTLHKRDISDETYTWMDYQEYGRVERKSHG